MGSVFGNYHRKLAEDHESKANELLRSIKMEHTSVESAVIASIAQVHATLALSHRTADLRDR